MAGIGGIGLAFNSTTLTQFVSGQSANIGVSQAKNDIQFDFGDILNGAAIDGGIFDVRVDNRAQFGFSSNLSFPSSEFQGITISAREVTIDVKKFSENFEQLDVGRRAYGLLLASKGLITEDELNSLPVVHNRAALRLEDSLQRLNIDTSKPFTVNGQKFQFEAGRIEMLSGQSAANADNAEIKERLSKAYARLGTDDGQSKRINGEDASVTEMSIARDELHEDFRFVFYDFDSDELVGTNNFADFAVGSANIPDAYFFGQSVGWQLGMASDMPQNVRNEVVMQFGQFFSSLVVQALTNVPVQTEKQLFEGFETSLKQYGFSTGKIDELVSDLQLSFDTAIENVFEAMDRIPDGADLGGLRESLGISFQGGIYTVERFV
ncbi:MAG: hypothetical protein L3J82_07520 [Planctomycetes bacterium]|nr:hypothetical protein [Planctomycetota bacterium]